MKGKASDWRENTKRRMIAECADTGKTKRETFNELRPLVESQIKPMIFAANVAGHRQPKPMHEQLIELKNEIGRVYAILGRSATSDFDSEDIEASEDIEIEEEQTEEEEEEEEEEPKEEEKPRAKGKDRIKNDLKLFLQRVREIRAFCEERARLSEPVDSISMRPAQAAARLIPLGVPVDALLDAMTMHWSSDTRADAHIRPFDFIGYSQQVMKSRGISTITRRDGNEESPHILFGYALILAEARQPIMMIGPAGTGKSHLAAQLADYLDLKYGETPMSPGATRGDLLGRHTIGGFISAEFVELYGGGGVFNFEEIDASDASMLIVLNNALASNRLYNSSSGEMVDKSPDFIAVSTANTFGLGANKDYTARERLDAATIDRWRMGRIFLHLDNKVEESILGI
jgi:hypothetical protein